MHQDIANLILIFMTFHYFCHYLIYLGYFKYSERFYYSIERLTSVSEMYNFENRVFKIMHIIVNYISFAFLKFN